MGIRAVTPIAGMAIRNRRSETWANISAVGVRATVTLPIRLGSKSMVLLSTLGNWKEPAERTTVPSATLRSNLQLVEARIEFVEVGKSVYTVG